MIRCCSCKKEYDFEGNIFEVDRNTNCPILICPHCGFKHAVSFMPFENKIENMKKAKKIELALNYPLLGASRIANALREDQSGIDDGNVYDGTPWDLSTFRYDARSFDVSGQDTNPSSVTFSPDGIKMYILGIYHTAIFQYTLSTAWDVSTAVYDKSVTLGGLYSPQEVAFSPDGTKMYVLDGALCAVLQYTLSTAWDIATASYADKFIYVDTQESNPTSVTFGPDGTKMYVLGAVQDTVFQYTLSTAWDVSTAVYADKSKNIGTQETAPTGVTFSPNGTKMYVVGNANDTVFQYTLSTAWDVSTAVYADKFIYVGTQEAVASSVTFSPDGIKMYIVGSSNDTVFQYASPVAWTKTNDFILATRIYGSKGAYNFAYKLKWRNVTDGGVFADVGETGEISFNAVTVLVDGQALAIESRICGVQSGYTWQNGMESEGDNRLPDSGTYSLADEYYTEFQWALDCNSAHDEDEYEFAIYELTNGTSIGTCLATITMAAIVAGLSMKWNGVAISKWNGAVINKLNGVD